MREPDRSVELSAPEPAVVAGDADRLRQVVDNLLVNAVRHTPPGTPIEVELRHDGDFAVIGVRDHGPGIPPEERSRIFEPFYRSDPSRSRATGGEGLGLAIVETIVRAHGGRVGVEGSEGEGARFWVRIPLARQLADGSEDSAVDPSATSTAAINGSAPATGAARGTVPVVGPRSGAEVGGDQP